MMASQARMSSGPASSGAFTTTSTASMSGLRAPFSVAFRSFRVFGDGAWATMSSRFFSIWGPTSHNHRALVRGQARRTSSRETLRAHPCALRSGHPWPPRFPGGSSPAPTTIYGRSPSGRKLLQQLATRFHWRLGRFFLNRLGHQFVANFGFDFVGDVQVLFQELAGVGFTLADFVAVVGVPGAGFVDEAFFNAHVQHFGHVVDALAVHDLELGLFERRRYLVLDDFYAGFVTDHFVTVFDSADAADVQAYGGVEFQSVTTGGGFRAAEHDADFHTDLVDEDHQAVGVFDVTGQFTQGLGHQAGLEAYVAVAHFAFDFGFRCQCGYGVDDDHVDGVGAHQHVGDFQGLFAGVWLGNQEVVYVYTELFCVDGVERVLSVDKCAGFARFLGFSYNLQGQCGFTGAFRAVDFNDPVVRQAANTQGYVQPEGTGGYRRNGFTGLVAHFHHGTFGELASNLAECCAECFLAIVFHWYLTLICRSC